MTTKKQTATILTLMFVGLTALANAQMSTTTLKAQVPFAFVVNGQTMPAGECVIQVVGTGGTLLAIRSGKHHAFAIADESSNGSKKTALVFHRYGDRYFLSGVKREGRMSYQLRLSRVEKELRAQNLAVQEFTLLASAN
jgi:hypothetical protein